MWRYSRNPIIPRDAIPTSNSIFNSAAVPFEGKFAGVFRCDNQRREMILHAGFSDDGYRWRIDHEPIASILPRRSPRPVYAYDARVCWVEDRYWVTWCNGFHGPDHRHRIHTRFQVVPPLGERLAAFQPKRRSLPAQGQRPLSHVQPAQRQRAHAVRRYFLSQSEDMIYWGRHRHVMSPQEPWESTKIGAGPCPIETSEGWLLFHHGVLTSCNGYVYHWGAVVLDLEKPWIVRYRCAPYLINPRELYECVGDVQNVTFPCAAMTDAPTGRIAVYYGCADTVTGLCFADIEPLFEFVKKNSSV